MRSEPHRLQYLDAMGLTAWVPKYQLPNALPSEACEWPQPTVDRQMSQGAGQAGAAREAGSVGGEPAMAPRERFQALLAAEGSPVLGSPPSQHDAQGEIPPQSQPEPGVGLQPSEGQAHWKFRLQVGCMAGRWLVIVPAQQALPASLIRLLGNLFTAAGIGLDQLPVLEEYRWPPFQGGSLQEFSHDPGQDARDGLNAFFSGRQRMGWHPHQVLVFGMDDTLRQLLAIESGRSTTLDLPVWLGPELDALSASAEGKRALWPRLADWEIPADD